MAMAEVAREGGADLAMSIYPKTPEHDHRATISAAVAAFELIAARYGEENIVVGGDSAGGGLTASLLTVLAFLLAAPRGPARGESDHHEQKGRLAAFGSFNTHPPHTWVQL